MTFSSHPVKGACSPQALTVDIDLDRLAGIMVARFVQGDYSPLPHCPLWKGVSKQSPHPGRRVALGDSPAWETCPFSPLTRVFGHLFTYPCGLPYLHFILCIIIQNVIMDFVASFGHWEPFLVGAHVPLSCSASHALFSEHFLSSWYYKTPQAGILPAPARKQHFSRGPSSLSLEPGVKWHSTEGGPERVSTRQQVVPRRDRFVP